MKRCLLLSLACLFVAMVLPLLLVDRPPVAAEVPVLPSPSARPLLTADEAVVFDVLQKDGSVVQVSMAEFLPGVLSGEMPAAFHEAALRAQAVAGRTYILSRLGVQKAAHPQAAVCTDPGCCQAWDSEERMREKWGADFDRYYGKIRSAVTDTDGACLFWEGEPILACFHSSSAALTESSAAVWSGALPYLVSVTSPETAQDVPNYVTTVELGCEAFREKIWSEYPGADLSGEPAGWIGEIRREESGRVESVIIGGIRTEAEALRSLFSLRSAAFTPEYTGTGFRFTVTGYGHGVGMSQYGANVMAARGSTWQEILQHYYPGAELKMQP
ncbi:MAG: stage II sporulation protein D [Ruminococcaceae bacterium]|nr:stage II sporulation protein D [Oscillospiraceae bacterium]